MIKKLVIGFVFTAFGAATMMAGGLLTNTNQSASFLRQISQDATIDITSNINNPAGAAFLDNGFHLSINLQNAKQTREVDTTFPLFAYNINNNQPTHLYKGDAYAPVLPSFQLAYVKDRWSVSTNFAVNGGGGKCEYDNGLGTFEALYASQIYSNVAKALAQTNAAYGSTLAFGGYDINAYMKGRQYYFGFAVGGTYKITENLAGYVGLRGVYANCNYNGWVEDATAKIVAGTSPVDAAIISTVQQKLDGQLSQTALSLNCDQKGFGVTPIIGIDWKINEQWNLAAKYEFKTRIRLENKTEMNAYTTQEAQSNPTLGQFADGKKVAGDIPAFFAIGAQYSPISQLRINAGYHFYDDCHATAYGDKQKGIDSGTWEITAGAEYDICNFVTVSAGWQTTNYNLSDAYMNDLSFTTSSNSVGGGVRLNVSSRASIDLGYMQTLYSTRDVTTATQAGDKKDSYTRTNRVLGIGFNLKF